MSDPVIETERLVLRKPSVDDEPGAAELLGDMEVMRWLGGETVPPEDVPAVIEKWMCSPTWTPDRVIVCSSARWAKC